MLWPSGREASARITWPPLLSHNVLVGTPLVEFASYAQLATASTGGGGSRSGCSAPQAFTQAPNATITMLLMNSAYHRPGGWAPRIYPDVLPAVTLARAHENDCHYPAILRSDLTSDSCVGLEARPERPRKAALLCVATSERAIVREGVVVNAGLDESAYAEPKGPSTCVTPRCRPEQPGEHRDELVQLREHGDVGAAGSSNSQTTRRPKSLQGAFDAHRFARARQLSQS
jgi:hypothetical protein